MFTRYFGETLKRFWRDFEDILKAFWSDFEEILKRFWGDFGAEFMMFYHLASGDWVADWPWWKSDLPKQDVKKPVCIYKQMLMNFKSC